MCRDCIVSSSNMNNANNKTALQLNILRCHISNSVSHILVLHLWREISVCVKVGGAVLNNKL